MGFDLSQYEQVKDRIPLFWEAHPDGAIVSQLLHHGAGEYIVESRLINSAGQVIANGHAREEVADRGVNSTSALENCETSAIGRALANAGFSAGPNRPSREEMTKADRGSPAVTTSDLATKPQLAKISHLVDKTGLIPQTWPLPDTFTKREASTLIDELSQEPVEPPAERVGAIRDQLSAVEDEFLS